MSKEKIIFTTKDEYDITEGMKYYSVKVKEYETHPDIKKLKGFKEPPLWSMCGPYINPEAHNPTGDIEYFYKKENAIEFINQNKDEIEDRTADIDEDMPGEFVKIKEENQNKEDE